MQGELMQSRLHRLRHLQVRGGDGQLLAGSLLVAFVRRRRGRAIGGLHACERDCRARAQVDGLIEIARQRLGVRHRRGRKPAERRRIGGGLCPGRHLGPGSKKREHLVRASAGERAERGLGRGDRRGYRDRRHRGAGGRFAADEAAHEAHAAVAARGVLRPGRRVAVEDRVRPRLHREVRIDDPVDRKRGLLGNRLPWSELLAVLRAPQSDLARCGTATAVPVIVEDARDRRRLPELEDRRPARAVLDAQIVPRGEEDRAGGALRLARGRGRRHDHQQYGGCGQHRVCESHGVLLKPSHLLFVAAKKTSRRRGSLARRWRAPAR
ncbi:MAG: hypothetical protein WCE83_13165, partial [Candidatus Baltobacteraceae bacterium]